MLQRIRDPFFLPCFIEVELEMTRYELVMPHPKRKKETKKKHNFQNGSLENKMT